MPIEPKEIASLWMQENSVVNQKTAYYFASVAILAWPVVFAANNNLLFIALSLSFLGILLSAFSFLSISRTAAYREHWRQALTSTSSEYRELFSNIQFKWHQRLSSNTVLIGLPAFGLLTWATVFVYFLGKMIAP